MLARLYTFTAGTTISSSQVNAELNQLVQLLSGQKLDTTLLKSTSTSDATLTVDNTGGGKVVEWKVGGAAKARVNAAGQIESVVSTGTAPLVVASTTKVANLNVDKLDDKDINDILLSVDPSIKVNGGGTSQIDLEHGSTAKVRLTNGTTDFSLVNVGTGLTLASVNKSTRVWSFPAAVSFAAEVSGITPTVSASLATKGYVDARKAVVCFTAYHGDGTDFASREVRSYVVPNGTTALVLRRLWGVSAGGSMGTNRPSCSVYWYRNGVFQGVIGTVAFPASHPVNQVYTVTLGTPVTLQAGDHFRLDPQPGASTSAIEITYGVEGDVVVI